MRSYAMEQIKQQTQTLKNKNKFEVPLDRLINSILFFNKIIYF